MSNIRTLVTVLACSLLSPLAMADAKEDKDMLKLATASGCMTCHSIESGKPGPDGMKPIGPAWTDVAAQYRDKPGATDFLTKPFSPKKLLARIDEIFSS